MERECGVCMDQYDNCNKIPKELRCGHTFCEQCLIEVLGGNKKSSSIVCPNCRRQTTYVTDIKSLPTNRRFLTTNINLDQPLHNPLNEEAHFLAKEIKGLETCMADYSILLKSIMNTNKEAVNILKSNYVTSYTALENATKTLIGIIKEHHEKINNQLITTMTTQQEALIIQGKLAKEKLGKTKGLGGDLQDMKNEVDVLLLEGENLCDDKVIRDLKDNFFNLSQIFEQELRFRPIQHIELSELTTNMQYAIPPMKCIKLMRNQPYLINQTKELSAPLQRLTQRMQNLKRPSILFFSQDFNIGTSTNPPNPTNSIQNPRTCKILKYDLLSEVFTRESVSFKWNIDLRLCDCISHPNNSCIYILGGESLVMYDVPNNIFLSKQGYLGNKSLKKPALTILDNEIYVVGGRINFDPQYTCSKFNIVSEKWAPVARLQIPRFSATATAINDYQVCVAGGENMNSLYLDSIELYNVGEKIWQLSKLKLPFPCKDVSLISPDKDRMLVYGGEAHGEILTTASELDFLKKNCCHLEDSHYPRAKSKIFMQNNAIYVFGGYTQKVVNCYGEKFCLSENKWVELGSTRELEDYSLFINRSPAALISE